MGAVPEEDIGVLWLVAKRTEEILSEEQAERARRCEERGWMERIWSGAIIDKCLHIYRITPAGRAALEEATK